MDHLNNYKMKTPHRHFSTISWRCILNFQLNKRIFEIYEKNLSVRYL